MIRFLYENELVELTDVEADLTVLDWLRIHRNRTGTKEGCGSGDCGACTVVIVSLGENDTHEAELKYQSMNSCIAFVGALHGKQLLSVESLEADHKLHPVQQAMVEKHGSQCGFCTPGFVMSMYALYQQNEPEDVLLGRVDQALGGNLCRCTGYRPIKDAVSSAMKVRQTNDDWQKESALRLQQLRSLSVEPIGNAQGFVQPGCINELAEHYKQHPTSRLLAGGTDLALEVTQQMKTLPHLVHIGMVPEMRIRQVTADHLLLGAAVSIGECLQIMSESLPAARDMLLRFGSDQVRNWATIGGNLGSASPIGDLPPLLLALDAIITLQCGDTTRDVPVQDYFLGYRKTCLKSGEFIRHVRIPLPTPQAFFAVYKISKRVEDDISSVCLAICLPEHKSVISNARLAFGGMAAIPIRAVNAEQALNGHSFDDAAVADAQAELAAELQPMSDARASAAYRMQIAQNLLQRALLESRQS